jgi:hypothetical protein
MRNVRHIAAVVAIGLAAACGGADIPSHSGYKNDKLKPWKKPKLIPFDEKGEGKADGDLSYAEYRRAKWYAVDLPSDGQLDVAVEISPGGEADDEFDLAMEILDPNFVVISKADLDEEDAHEVLKARSLYELSPGRYLIHLYLERRIDTAEFDLKVKFLPQAKEYESTFPAQVAFLPRLPVVPLLDDTPADQIARKKNPEIGRTGRKRPPKTTATKPDTTKKIAAQVVNVVVSGSDSVITVNRGTSQGVEDGMKGYVTGVKEGGFTVTSCTERNCKGKVKATPDQISKSGKVLIVVGAGDE